MKDFLFFVFDKYATSSKNFLELQLENFKSFYKKLYSEYISKKYTFHPGRWVSKPKRKPKYNYDPFDKDKGNLLKETEKFYIVLGSFINKYSGRNVHLDWNEFIWQPHREIKSFIDYIQLQRLPRLPPPIPPPLIIPPSPTCSDFSDSDLPIRRAKRNTKQYPDTLASCDEERCKVCMTNRKIICFMPCGHIGMCNACCAQIYKKRFSTSIYVSKPYICDTLPLPPKNNLNYENEDSFIYSIIEELTQPRYHHSKNCIFCKEKIQKMQLIFSV